MSFSQHIAFHVRTIAAQHYRRIVIQRQQQNAGSPETAPTWNYTGTGFTIQGRNDTSAPRQRGVNDGRGFCFVGHTGDVYPSGFLQVKAGNVRQQSLVDVYRSSPLFRALRDPAQLKGKCGACEYRQVCGGSRARAFALTGDCLASDPSCVYVPPGARG